MDKQNEVMTTTIQLENITFTHDGALTPIFKNVTINIDTNWRLGIIGRNGRGKTTLLNLIAGRLQAQKGICKCPEKVSMFPVKVENNLERVDHVIKDLIGPVRAIEDELKTLLGRTSEEALERYGDLVEKYEFYRGYELDALIEREIRLLSLDPKCLDQKFKDLSGGEKTKVQIAALFLRPQNYLLIDEPTNHLDIHGRAELADYLSQKKGFSLVSHDQAFIDECCDHILEIGKAGIKIEKGNYSSWDDNRRQLENFELDKKAKLEKEVGKLTASARMARGYSNNKEKEKIGAGDKGFVGARSARLMKRAKNLENRREKKLDEAKSLLKSYESIRRLELKQSDLSQDKYLEFHNLSFSYGDKKVIETLNLTVNKGDRIWLRGENGAGKSTLLKLITGELTSDDGFTHRAIDLRITQAFQDMPIKTGLVKDYLDHYQTDITAFVRMLDYFNMNVDYLDRQIETLSEGERKKLDLARAFSSDAPLYVWDEPLNYMDYHFRVQLEEAVLKYKPTVIFVEHDRSFGEKIATKIINIGQ